MPFFWVRAQFHSMLFGSIQPVVDLALTLVMGKVCINLWTKRDLDRWAKVGRQPVEEVWPALVAADKVATFQAIGPDVLMAQAETGNNMLVYRIPPEKGGGVLLHNCVFLDDPKLEELQQLGPVRAIICPSMKAMPRCMQFAEKLGVDVYMTRLLTVPTSKCITEWNKQWKAPLVAEEAPVEQLYGVKVHEPSGTKGHNRDGQTYPAENFYEFPQADGSCILACGTLLCDRDTKWELLPSYETKLEHVTVPHRVLKDGLNNEPAFEAFLHRMLTRNPKYLVPSVGQAVPDPGPTLQAAVLEVDRWIHRPRWLF
eukprot:EG_transcript_17066